MSEFFYDLPRERGRLYKVECRDGTHYYEFEVRRTDSIEATARIADFMDGGFLGLTDDDKRRALSRKSKAHARH